MRQITKLAVSAFLTNQNFNRDNTRIEIDNNETKMYLHNNLIAVKTGNKIKISNAGWSSNTTKERLNGIFDQLNRSQDKIYQKNYTWHWKDHVDFPSNEFVKIN